MLKRHPAPGVDAEQAKGRITVDVVVTDWAGNPVPDLEPKNFTLSDNNHPQQVVSFQTSDIPSSSPDSSISIVLVIDTVNSNLQDVNFVRNEVERFLQQGGGHLAHPVTLILLTDSGFRVQGQPSVDGGALARVVHAIQPAVHTIHSAAGGEAELERFQLSVRSLSTLISNQIREPGRKLLVWTGPGWPTLRGGETIYNARGHQLNFNVIASLTNGLREARMTVCSAGGGTPFFFQEYMGGVKSVAEANSGNLALQVFAVRSGGLTLEAGNRSRSADQINDCLREFSPFYTLQYDRPRVNRDNEYHEIKVKVDRPGLKVHTTSGYYGQLEQVNP